MANGHRLVDVWGYSMAAVQVYVDLVIKRRRTQLYDLVVGIRHAQGGDAKVFGEFMNGLQGDD